MLRGICALFGDSSAKFHRTISISAAGMGRQIKIDVLDIQLLNESKNVSIYLDAELAIEANTGAVFPYLDSILLPRQLAPISNTKLTHQKCIREWFKFRPNILNWFSAPRSSIKSTSAVKNPKRPGSVNWWELELFTHGKFSVFNELFLGFCWRELPTGSIASVSHPLTGVCCFSSEITACWRDLRHIANVSWRC